MATLIYLQSNFSSKHTAVSRLYKLFLACLISSFILSGVPFVFYFDHHAAMAASASKTAGPVETYLLQFAPHTSEMERAQVLAEMNAVLQAHRGRERIRARLARDETPAPIRRSGSR